MRVPPILSEGSHQSGCRKRELYLPCVNMCIQIGQWPCTHPISQEEKFKPGSSFGLCCPTKAQLLLFVPWNLSLRGGSRGGSAPTLQRMGVGFWVTLLLRRACITPLLYAAPHRRFGNSGEGRHSLQPLRKGALCPCQPMPATLCA